MLAEQRREARAQLREGLRRDDEGLVVETMADGHESIDLQGRFQHVTSLVETAEGEMVPMCSGVLPPKLTPGKNKIYETWIFSRFWGHLGSLP